jgi:hypothetical protein
VTFEEVVEIGVKYSATAGQGDAKAQNVGIRQG